MMISPAGWGLLWNNAAVTDVDVAVPGAPQPLAIRSEAGRGVDYDFILGPEMDDIIRGYRWMTGDAPLMARWTWGMWQSKERYETQAQLLSIPNRYRQMGIPIDAATQSRLRQDVELRYRLLPYLYSTSWAVYNQQKSLMRALAFDFRTDPKALAVMDQYLFGPALLVAPVLEAHAQHRDVYLPGTDLWFDFWTGRAWQGGQQIESKVDIAAIPVFVRAGSIVPFGPVRPYANAPSDQPLELRVYPGRDASFTLYDDAGDGYGYLSGEKTTINIDWLDRSRKLRIGTRRGAYPGMPATLAMKVVCGAAPGSEIPLIRYDGRARELTFRACSAGLRAQRN